MSEIKFGNLVAKEGEKVQGYVTVPGTDVKMPATLINGVNDGKTVVITGGTHGGEYPGVETSIRVAAMLKPEDVSGALIVVHPVNTPAFFAKMQYVSPLDGKNLNRMYPGKAMGTVSERMAYMISSELFTQADFYMDLHGGDIHEDLVPFVIHSYAGPDEVNQISKEVSATLGIPYLCGSRSTNGTFGCAAAMGVPGFLAELGKCGLWCEGEVKAYLDGVLNALKYLGVIEGTPKTYDNIIYLDHMDGNDAEQTGCWYPCVKPGDPVEKGQKVGEIRDCFGNLLGEYFSPLTGTVLYVCSSLAINAGDPLTAMG